MQKKRLIIIGISLCVLFSLIRLYNLEFSHASDIEKSSVIRFRYLIGAHVLLLLALTISFFLQEIYSYLIVAFLFFIIVTIAFMMCESTIKKMPGHKEDEDYLALQEQKLKRKRQKTYLSIYYLIYMYSVIGSIMLGLFLFIRFLMVRWYERQLDRELQTAVSIKPFSDELKGKECTICISDFAETGEEFCQLNNCQHVFHMQCIRQWVHYSRTCPLCRVSIFNQRRRQHNESH